MCRRLVTKGIPYMLLPHFHLDRNNHAASVVECVKRAWPAADGDGRTATDQHSELSGRGYCQFYRSDARKDGDQMGLISGTKRLLPKPTGQSAGQQADGQSLTVADSFKTGFILFVGGVCPFAILLVLTISAGYYFNALRGFSADVQSIVAYGTAAIVELVNLALFFVSAKAFWSGKRAHFITALLIGLALTCISVIAQVLYLSNNLDKASLGTGAAILSTLPLVGGLASTALIIVTRALALHVAEFACCYVIARSSISHRKIIQAQQEQQEAELAMLEAQQYAAFRKALHQAQMTQLQQIQQQMISAPHLAPPPAGQLAEGHGDAWTGKVRVPTKEELQHYGEGSQNGHRTFR